MNVSDKEYKRGDCFDGSNEGYQRIGPEITSVSGDMEKLKSVHIAGGNLKWYMCYGKSVGIFSRS